MQPPDNQAPSRRTRHVDPAFARRLARPRDPALAIDPAHLSLLIDAHVRPCWADRHSSYWVLRRLEGSRAFIEHPKTLKVLNVPQDCLDLPPNLEHRAFPGGFDPTAGQIPLFLPIPPFHVERYLDQRIHIKGEPNRILVTLVAVDAQGNATVTDGNGTWTVPHTDLEAPQEQPHV